MTPEKRINRLTNWQIALFVIPVAIHTLRLFRLVSKEVDGQPTWTWVRFGITVLALVGVGILGLQKRKIRRAGHAPVRPDQPSFDI